MKKIYLISLILILYVNVRLTAQSISISDVTHAPASSAVLDIYSTSKGLLVPRIALTGTTDVTTITAPAISLLVFNTSTTGDVTPGYYFWIGSVWVRIATGSGFETDPIVRAINGLVKSDGTTISAALAGVDYLTPGGSAALLTNFPTLNQNTTGNAATVTTNANLKGDVTSTGNDVIITNKAVTLAKMNDLPTASLVGRNAAGTGIPEVLDVPTVRAMLNIPADASINTNRVITLAGTNVTGQNLGAGGKTMAQFFDAFFFPPVPATPPASTFTTTTSTFPYSTWKNWGNPPTSNLSFAWSVNNMSIIDKTDDKAITSIKLKNGATELANVTPTGGNQSGNFTGIPFTNTLLDPTSTFTKTYTLEIIDAQPQTVLKNIELTMSPAIRLTYAIPTLVPSTTVYEYDVNNKAITLNWAITPNDETITNISVDGTSNGRTTSTGTQAVIFKTLANGGTVSKTFPLIVTGNIYGAGTAQNPASISWDNRLYRGTITSALIPNDRSFTFSDAQVKALASETKLGGNWKSTAGYDFACGAGGQYVVFAYPDDAVTPVVQYYDPSFNSWMTYLPADLAIINRTNFSNQFGYTGTSYKLIIVCVQYFGQSVKVRIQ